jgi:hypothetical protein
MPLMSARFCNLTTVPMFASPENFGAAAGDLVDDPAAPAFGVDEDDGGGWTLAPALGLPMEAAWDGAQRATVNTKEQIK